MALKHIKTAVGADDPDPNKIQAGDWNNSHVIDSLGISIPSSSPASIPTPSSGQITLFTDNLSLSLSQKDSDGSVKHIPSLGLATALSVNLHLIY